MRVALYARFSTDLQNSLSADDQLQHLRSALQSDWQEVAAFKDEAISGAHIVTRPGLIGLIKFAQAGECDIIFAEALDRISRDSADLSAIFKQLEYRRIKIYTTSQGEINWLQISFHGIMGQMFIEQTAEKTRRGQIANVNRGLPGGGSCYGYKSVNAEHEIIQSEAEIIRRIFSEYADGWSPNKIAHRLNAEGVPGPRHGNWSASGIYGDRRIGDGILHQPLYRGEMVFNRRSYRKHPDTGKRSSIVNPGQLWKRTPVPHLRIVDQGLWDRAHAKMRELSAEPKTRIRRPTRLLSGLLVCGLCGGPMTIGGRDSYQCSAHKAHGTCMNARFVKAESTERRVLDGLREYLLTPELIEQAMSAFAEEQKAARRTGLAQRAAWEKQEAEAVRAMDFLLDLYTNGKIDLESFERKSSGLEAKRDGARSELAKLAELPPYEVHPNAVARYRQIIDDLSTALRSDAGQAARQALRGLLDKVVFWPEDGKGQYRLEVQGRLAALLSRQTPTSPKDVEEGRLLMGAGTGFEPVTFRL